MTVIGSFETFDAGFANIFALAADADGVYVVTQAADPLTDGETIEVVRLPLCGGASTRLGSWTTPPNSGGVTAAFAGSHRVFVFADSGVYSLSTSGGAITTETTASVPSDSAVLSGGALYWIDSTSVLWSVATGGGKTPRIVAQSTVSGQAWTSVAADATNAYVTVTDNSDATAGSLVALPLSGGPSVTLASGLPDPGHVILANGSLYFTMDTPGPPSVEADNDTSAIESLALPTGSPTGVVLGETPAPESLVMLGTTLYWVDSGGTDGVIVRSQPAEGATTTVVVPGVEGVEGVTVAAGGVYWYSSDDELVFAASF